MKYLVLVAVIVAVLWLMRSRSGSVSSTNRREARKDTGPQPMIACTHCGIHLPRNEAVGGVQGLYCSEAHRLARGDSA